MKSNLDKAAVYLSDARSDGHQGADARRQPLGHRLRHGHAPRRSPTRSRCRPASPGAITFGLSAIRNVGEGLVELLLAERDANGPFDSFHDFAERVPEPVLNKRTVESLIKAGAFDALGHPRRGLLMVFEQIIDGTLVRRRERDQGVMSLFGDLGGDSVEGFDERVADPRQRVRQERPAAVREGDARPVRVATTRCSASRRRCAARSTAASPRRPNARTARCWCSAA